MIDSPSITTAGRCFFALSLLPFFLLLYLLKKSETDGSCSSKK